MVVKKDIMLIIKDLSLDVDTECVGEVRMDGDYRSFGPEKSSSSELLDIRLFQADFHSAKFLETVEERLVAGVRFEPPTFGLLEQRPPFLLSFISVYLSTDLFTPVTVWRIIWDERSG